MADYPIYTLLFRLILPFILLRLGVKSIKEPLYRRFLSERFGKPKTHRAYPIWVHGVSVGEIQAAYPLIAYYHAQQKPLLVTTTTGAGRETAEKLYGKMATVAYLPYDDPIFIQRFLTGYQPSLTLIMETELWPNLIAGCRRHHIPTWIVNGRLSPRSVKRYRAIGFFVQRILNDLTGIITQSQTDYERFKSLGGGVPLCVAGNLKFDREPASDIVHLGQQWRKRLGQKPIVAFASTRQGEEALILQHLTPLVEAGIRVLIVPRHPARFSEVARLIEEAGYACFRRSDDHLDVSLLQTQRGILLGDSIGEMPAYYALADVAVIGGTWLPYGGQNPIEPLWLHKPVVVGPFTDHFADIVREGTAVSAIVQKENLASAIPMILSLIHDKTCYQRYVHAGQAFLAQHQGAVKRVIHILETGQCGQ